MQYSVFWKKCRGVAPLLYFIRKSNTCLENRGCSAPWERNPLSTHFRQQLWHSLTNVLVQVCAKLPSQGSEPPDWNTIAYEETQYYEVEPLGVCSIFWEKQVMIVCVQYALPYVKSFLKITCHTEKWEEGWALLQDVLHLSTSCIFLQECCFLLREYLVFTAISLKKLNLSQNNCQTRQMRGRMSFIKGCIASFHTL